MAPLTDSRWGKSLTIQPAKQLSGQNYSTLVVEAGPDGSWNNAVKYADDLPYPPVFCNRNLPQYGEDGNKLPTTIDAGGCIGGSTSSMLKPLEESRIVANKP